MSRCQQAHLGCSWRPPSLSVATIVMIAVLLTLLGLVLIPVNLGLLPFSPDGLQGLLLLLFAV
jgi:hypothetical protein